MVYKMDNEQLEILKILKENHLRELNNHNTTGMDNYNLLKENSVEIFWGALIRFALLYMLYIALYIISITLCFIINYNMLFAIVYFVLFLVLTQIIETTATFASISSTLAQLTLTHQLDQIIYMDTNFSVWHYIVGSTVSYSVASMVLGSIILNRKDIR